MEPHSTKLPGITPPPRAYDESTCLRRQIVLEIDAPVVAAAHK